MAMVKNKKLLEENMKRFISFIMTMLFVLMASYAMAAPFLTCDPIPEATYYHVINNDTGDGAIVDALAGGILKQDLVAQMGTQNIRVAAGNEWGISDYTDFSYPAGKPGSPLDTQLVFSDGKVFVSSRAENNALEFIVLDNKTGLVSTVVAVDGAMSYEVTGIGAGKQSLSISASNLWGQGDTVPFSFTAGTPPVPANLRLEK